MPVTELVFWHSVVSPHMAYLACEMAARGISVTYVAGIAMSPERLQQGWKAPAMPGVRLKMASDKHRSMAIAESFSPGAVHLVQGLGREGKMAQIISVLRHRRARWGVVMETVVDRGLKGRLKRRYYRWKLRDRTRPDFILAIGTQTLDWLVDRGFPRDQVFPFAYFLEPPASPVMDQFTADVPFNIGFVGQLIPRKRLDWLIESLASIGTKEFRLTVIGSGLLEAELHSLALRRLGATRVCWLGQLPMAETRQCIASFDCLVLPSENDGWGAVVVEALMAGVPVICSDTCGAAMAVTASGVGGVFPQQDHAALGEFICKAMRKGKLDHPAKVALSNWASCFAGVAGADYLTRILESRYMVTPRPEAPWKLDSEFVQ